MPNLDKLWQRLRAALLSHTPKAVEALSAGASEARIRRLENALGGPLPLALADSLKVHDGQRLPCMSELLFDNEYLLSCDQIASTWAMRNEVASDFRRDHSPVTSKWWDSIYVPVTESDGNGFCVHRTTGAVFYHVHDGEMEGPFFPSWSALLDALAGKVERGEFELDHGSVWVEFNAEGDVASSKA